MAKVTYHIIEHDGGWAYEASGAISETFPTHDAAFLAARQAALRQQRPGETTGIVWEDEAGRWHAEVSSGDARPQTEVEDDA
ncbi:DUF2188 domain-containing protein [Jiella pelagia]|uniref:DUF2188 domain-containing protein n=1 Tax=Jiella pelagia TaxID=2986949 RepID=A0ABY7BZV0_9HYPH|nr:DUF2188 domain-containing protein [Jiella pelagia]WAP68625.1 DUF2188 domain-containing protein [Jiella pelagia]